MNLFLFALSFFFISQVSCYTFSVQRVAKAALEKDPFGLIAELDNIGDLHPTCAKSIEVYNSNVANVANCLIGLADFVKNENDEALLLAQFAPKSVTYDELAKDMTNENSEIYAAHGAFLMEVSEYSRWAFIAIDNKLDDLVIAVALFYGSYVGRIDTNIRKGLIPFSVVANVASQKSNNRSIVSKLFGGFIDALNYCNSSKIASTIKSGLNSVVSIFRPSTYKREAIKLPRLVKPSEIARGIEKNYQEIPAQLPEGLFKKKVAPIFENRQVNGPQTVMQQQSPSDVEAVFEKFAQKANVELEEEKAPQVQNIVSPPTSLRGKFFQNMPPRTVYPDDIPIFGAKQEQKTNLLKAPEEKIREQRKISKQPDLDDMTPSQIEELFAKKNRQMAAELIKNSSPVPATKEKKADLPAPEDLDKMTPSQIDALFHKQEENDPKKSAVQNPQPDIHIGGDLAVEDITKLFAELEKKNRAEKAMRRLDASVAGHQSNEDSGRSSDPDELAEAGFRGISNKCRYSCYVNSIFQILMHVPEFNDEATNFKLRVFNAIPVLKHFKDISKSQWDEKFDIPCIDKAANIFADFDAHIRNISGTTWATYNDASEFLVAFFDHLEGELTKIKKSADFINDAFAFKLVDKKHCKECGGTFKTDVKNLISIIELGAVNAETEEVTLEECINLFKCEKGIQYVHDKPLAKNSIAPVRCSNKLVSKTTRVETYPKYLFISINRTRYDAELRRPVKVHTGVRYPLKDFRWIHSRADEDTPRYRLKAVVIHRGSELSGHYYCLLRVSTQWYKFNDAKVTRISSKEVYSQNAVLLLYRQSSK